MTEKEELITVDGITLGGKTLSAFGSYILGTQVSIIIAMYISSLNL